MFFPGNCCERMLFLELNRQVLYMICKPKKIFFFWQESTCQFQSVYEWSSLFLWLDIFKRTDFTSVFNWNFALCGVPPQPALGKSAKRISHTGVATGGAAAEMQKLYPQGELLESQQELWVCSIQGGNVWRIRDCTHSLENVCCIYLPSDKYSSKSKTTWLFTEFKDSFLALELYKWLC